MQNPRCPNFNILPTATKQQTLLAISSSRLENMGKMAIEIIIAILLLQSISAEGTEKLSNGSNQTIEYQLLQYPGISNEAFEIFRIGVNFGSFLHHQNQMQQQFKRLIKHLPEDINHKTLKNKLSRIQLKLEYISKTTEILKHGFQIKKTNPHLIPLP